MIIVSMIQNAKAIFRKLKNHMSIGPVNNMKLSKYIINFTRGRNKLFLCYNCWIAHDDNYQLIYETPSLRRMVKHLRRVHKIEVSLEVNEFDL